MMLGPVNPIWQLVDETTHKFETTCLGCGRHIEAGEEKWADLNGEPFIAYYCTACHSREPLTHLEASLNNRSATPCTAQSITFGGRCLNCGWEPGMTKAGHD